MNSPFGNWHSMLKVSLVYEIDGWRHVAGRVNHPLPRLNGSRHQRKPRSDRPSTSEMRCNEIVELAQGASVAKMIAIFPKLAKIVVQDRLYLGAGDMEPKRVKTKRVPSITRSSQLCSVAGPRPASSKPSSS